MREQQRYHGSEEEQCHDGNNRVQATYVESSVSQLTVEPGGHVRRIGPPEVQSCAWDDQRCAGPEMIVRIIPEEKSVQIILLTHNNLTSRRTGRNSSLRCF